MSETIARLPEYRGDEEWCDICGDDNVALVIHGGVHDAPKKIVLCSKHAGQMAKEMELIGIVDSAWEKKLLIDVICGKGFVSIEDADKLVKSGFADFTGNQHKEEWSWRKNALEKLSAAELLKIYYR